MRSAFQRFVYFCILLLIGLTITVYSGDSNKKAPAIKKGAEVTTAIGVTRRWADVNKVPLDQRTTKRRMRPITNFERDRKIVRLDPDIDPVLQSSIVEGDRAVSMPAPLIDFAGMNLNSNGAGWPPDTNGDIGINHYVQGVNTSIGIFNKTTGALISAATFDDFFDGVGITGTPSDSDNNGDPIILFDQYAQRWFILDFAWASPETDGSYYSIAVSKTSDPTGDWWLYAFKADDNLMNDYPKVGIWNDGIYISANMFQFTGSFQHAKVWALKKPDLYNGTLIAQSVVDSTWYGWSILPSNAKGATPPPSDAPNYMYSFDADEWGHSPDDVLIVWKYDVDWVTPANTTWTGPSTIPIASFNLHSTNIPQRDTATTLDALGGRLMYGAMYRKFAAYEAVYLCHVASSGGIAGMRWYEVRLSGGNSSVYQQGTYIPDSNHRWMGSIGADKYGNIALGYSVSSSSMYPAIRYAGRKSGDPLNLLTQGENTLIAGIGSQTGFNRWGDYSFMSIDPVDDETFWYTQEYYNTTGTNWQTRVGSFKMNSKLITVSSPNGSESWEIGSTKNISWSASGLTNDVKLTLWKDDALAGLIVKDIDPSAGTYSWTVGNHTLGTASSGSGYKTKVREQGGVLFTTEDSSDTTYTLTPQAATITVTSPNGAESWNLGSTHNISWSAGGLTNDVKLTLWKDGSLVGLIVKDIDPSAGTYSWTVGTHSGGTAPAGTGYKIKIREQGGASFTTEDLSDSSFNISQVTITSPDGGESWTIGDVHNITWSASGLINNVKLTLWKDGSLVGLIVKDLDPSSGTYSWTAGNHTLGTASSGSGYKIKIREQGGTLFTTEDNSNTTFILLD